MQEHAVNRLRKWIAGYFRQTHIAMTPLPRLRDVIPRLKSQYAFPLTTPTTHRRNTFNGTVAISQVVQDMALGQGDRVLLPAYLCGSELGPFEHVGCEIAFYNVHGTLQIDLDDITRQLDSRTRAVYVTHYFGFPQIEIAAVAALCTEAGVALIEDCAHALFSRHGTDPIGRHGQYAVFSPRKSLPLVDGGVVIAGSALNPDGAWSAEHPPVLPMLDRVVYGLQQSARVCRGSAASVLQRALIAVLMPVSVVIKLMRKAIRLPAWAWETAEVEGSAAVPFYSTRMSALGDLGLRATDPNAVCRARRDNYTAWLTEITAVPGCKPVLDGLADGVCPLYFPVFTDQASVLVQHLKAHDIEAFHWWPHLHPAVEWNRYPHLRALKGNIVALPVHQQLSRSAIRRIVDIIGSGWSTDTGQSVS